MEDEDDDDDDDDDPLLPPQSRRRPLLLTLISGTHTLRLRSWSLRPGLRAPMSREGGFPATGCG